VEAIIPHLAFAVRSLLKDKAFSVAAFLTLALCVGANTILFSVVHSVLLCGKSSFIPYLTLAPRPSGAVAELRQW
jgi:hypothetical protein